MGYPDDVSGPDLCHMEGCIGDGHCPRCGETNYPLLGYRGAVARWAKVWNVSRATAESMIEQHQAERLLRETDLFKEGRQQHEAPSPAHQ